MYSNNERVTKKTLYLPCNQQYMKLKLLLLFIVFLSLNVNAQCSLPPPPGYYPIYSIDLDNDGFAPFDIAYIIEHVHKPNMEQYYNVSSSGYNFEFYNTNHDLSALTYTNIVIDEWGSIKNVYSGSEPTFDPQPPCYWIFPDEYSVRLIPVPFDGDMDGDGITNKMEDTNNNLNLMDDDDDHDGIINLLDPVALGVASSGNLNFKIYPNPVTNGSITFQSTVTPKAITIYDFTGKLLVKKTISSNILDVSMLVSGTYLLKAEVNDISIFKKIVIR